MAKARRRSGSSATGWTTAVELQYGQTFQSSFSDWPHDAARTT